VGDGEKINGDFNDSFLSRASTSWISNSRQVEVEAMNDVLKMGKSPDSECGF